MANSPTVTAVVRTYERPDLVQRAIDSVLEQTYDDYELLIVDDYSRDRTPEVLASCERKHERVKVLRHDENMGPGAAFNTAKQQARGKYVAYLDDDDEWRPKKLEVQVEKMEKLGPEYGMVTGGVKHIDQETGEEIDTFEPDLDGDAFSKVLKKGSGSVLGPPSVNMLRKSVIDKLGDFREDMPRGCGQQYYRRMAREYKISHVDYICLNYYVHPDRITTHSSIEDIRDEIKSRKIIFDEFEEDLKQFPSGYARELKRHGHFHCLAGETSAGRKYFRRAIKVNGLDRTVLIQIMASLFGSSGYQYVYRLYDKFG